MQAREPSNWYVMILLCALILLAYSNTFDASWQFDDFHNITENNRNQIENLYPSTLHNVLFNASSNNKIFDRPISHLSFAFNWYFSQKDVFGYHTINTTIHIFTAFFLYFTIVSLFKTPNLLGTYTGREHFIAFLAAVLWAVNPIQTQAVTYIVQRMASMAALFYLIGILFYIKGRICSLWSVKLIFYFGVFLSFALAVGSKENALMLPVSLFVVELVFFRDISNPRTRKHFIWLGCALSVVLFAIGLMLFMSNGFISRLQEGYANRTFTLTERLLTQPRIVIFYISQIFYPIADRLSIVHDFEISTGLFRPWTTLPAILFILGLIGAAFWQIKKHPLISFAILFFFLNHVIESSIIPLELVFEHRNYLPSLFLFVPVAAGFKWIIDYYLNKQKVMAGVIIGFVSLLVMVLGIGTYVRNIAWANEQTLWRDALNKAPQSARPYHNLATGFYAEIGNYDKVEELCEKAMGLYDSTKHKAKILSLDNIANAYAKRDEDYDKVIRIYNQVLKIEPERSRSRYHLSLALIHTGQIDKALENINQLSMNHPDTVQYLNIKAFILLKQNNPKDALPNLKRAIQENPDDEKTLLNAGLAKLLIGKHESATHFLSRIPGRSPQKATALLLQIENSVRGGDTSKAKEYAEQLIARTSPQKIRETIQKANEPGLTWPISEELVVPVIAEVLQKQSLNMSGLLKKTANDEG